MSRIGIRVFQSFNPVSFCIAYFASGILCNTGVDVDDFKSWKRLILIANLTHQAMLTSVRRKKPVLAGILITWEHSSVGARKDLRSNMNRWHGGPVPHQIFATSSSGIWPGLHQHQHLHCGRHPWTPGGRPRPGGRGR